ncbi:hypothetical protein MAXJ12_32699 [Mesorhizobium alhagi CCNWXJ12-2]|uniref:Uncharacterized protein n=1 Tax=Mesorhizobium alhagi CCNWXJ12-2 TaxID=1107882 RepID=H0I242_9HYPH|nr:hypothetical protein MAXJ12_32699 [Mesorhizobium alhagi CCNWXJ12-2]
MGTTPQIPGRGKPAVTIQTRTGSRAVVARVTARAAIDRFETKPVETAKVVLQRALLQFIRDRLPHRGLSRNSLAASA